MILIKMDMMMAGGMHDFDKDGHDELRMIGNDNYDGACLTGDDYNYN